MLYLTSAGWNAVTNIAHSVAICFLGIYLGREIAKGRDIGLENRRRERQLRRRVRALEAIVRPKASMGLSMPARARVTRDVS
jgi:hypothetical protein